MDLNFFRNINNSRDDRASFFKEFTDMLEKSLSKDDVRGVNVENELSLLQQVQKDEKVMVIFRDKMHVERSKILDDYANATADKGEMYFVYNKDFQGDNKYHLSSCGAEKTYNVIEAEKSELPVGAGVDSVLRMQNGEYVLDSRATDEIFRQMQDMVSRVLEEQSQLLREHRIEGHIYEVGEIEADRVWLFDITKDDVDGIEAVEEIEFPKEILSQVNEGTKVKFENGKYSIIS